MSVESDDDGWYVDAVAPLMLFQLPNVAFHCCHWYVYVGAGLPDHDPVLHASVGAGDATSAWPVVLLVVMGWLVDFVLITGPAAYTDGGPAKLGSSWHPAFHNAGVSTGGAHRSSPVVLYAAPDALFTTCPCAL